jgi:hypothetical protein
MNGTSTTYIRKRLRREGKSALLAAVETGKLSAFAAAVSLGWVQRPKKSNGGRPRKHREQRRDVALSAINGELSLGQLQELWLGPSHSYGSLFATREELQTAWEQNKDEVMALWGSHGRRPCIFYEFEWSGPRPAYAVERSTLWRAGVLGEAEKAELEAEWKAEFDHAAEPNFMFHAGSAGILKGDQARLEHYRWADIPDELVRAWRDVCLMPIR